MINDCVVRSFVSEGWNAKTEFRMDGWVDGWMCGPVPMHDEAAVEVFHSTQELECDRLHLRLVEALPYPSEEREREREKT